MKQKCTPAIPFPIQAGGFHEKGKRGGFFRSQAVTRVHLVVETFIHSASGREIRDGSPRLSRSAHGGWIFDVVRIDPVIDTAAACRA
jgi:hypothetical protein